MITFQPTGILASEAQFIPQLEPTGVLLAEQPDGFSVSVEPVQHQDEPPAEVPVNQRDEFH